MMILQQTRGNLSSGDQLALDLPFAETKSLAARIGPTPIFSRASGATYVGSDGLIHGIDTSTTSNSISTGSKSFTLTATAGQDQLWRTGDAVEAANGVNSMVGTVTSYNASTQVLVCNMTSISGTGTFTSWRIGYRGPRFDHNPVSPFASRGLLIEEGRTNLWTASEGLGASPWLLINTTTLNSDNTTAPDGLTTADKFTVGSTTQEYGFFRNTFSFVSGTAYSISCFFKANQITRVSIAAGNTALLPISAIFDLTGSGSVIGAPTGTASIQGFSNGWYRCSVSATALLSGITSIRFIAVSGTSTSYSGNSVDSFFAWGAQLEAGSFPTSYIPTTTSALARSEDVCSITGANFTGMWNASEGTIFAAHYQYGATGFGAILTADGGADVGKVQIGRNGTTQGYNSIKDNANTVVFEYAPTSSLVSGRNKSSLAYKQNDSIGTINNLSSALDTSVTLGTQTQLLIGGDFVGAGRRHNGAIDSIRVYKKRLSLAKLQALTA